MGRKRAGRGFQWVREDQEDEAIERVVRETNRQTRAEDSDVEGIVNQLLSRGVRERAELDLPSVLEGALVDHGRLSGGPKNRNMRRLKGLVRGLDDVDALREALAGETASERRAHQLERWRTRLITGTDADLQAFVDAHPGADRSAIRPLIRAARKDTPAGRKAHQKLFQTLKAAVPLTNV